MDFWLQAEREIAGETSPEPPQDRLEYRARLSILRFRPKGNAVMPINALAFNCTLKSAKGGEPSSTDALLSQLVDQLHKFKRVLERINAFIEELDDKNRMKTFGKVGLVVVVGNEDGAHHVAAEIYQALNDLGFSLPPTAVTYWVGEAMTGKEYSEFKKPPEKVAVATAMAAAGAAHLAKLLKANPYPGGEA
jgi:hypothetical protein